MVGMGNLIGRREWMGVLAAGMAVGQEARVRARELGLAPGIYGTGALNAITDVKGVRVGHTTLVRGDDVRTGVTAILAHGGNLFQDKRPGGVFVGNAFGKLVGSTQVQELGTIETPIVLTNTLAVGTAMEAVVRWTLGQAGNERVMSVNALVGETNDGGLNDIRALPVRVADVLAAIGRAAEGEVEEGSVGAGTGTVCYGWKGGIGTSSRVLPAREGGYTVGVLVQSNFGGVLTMGGAPVGRELGRADAPGDGSCMLVVATDAPLNGRGCQRLAARAVFGMGRTGASYSNGSGDFGIAFSTAVGVREVGTDAQSPLFQAVLEATEEASYNSLLRATTVTSKKRTVEAIPIGRVREILRRYSGR
jgi:D-aminopeptidase